MASTQASYVDEIIDGKQLNYRVIPNRTDHISRHFSLINEPNKNMGISIEKSIIESNLFFSNNIFNFSILLDNCYIKGTLIFTNATFNNNITLRNCFIDGNIIFIHSTFNDQITIAATKLKGEINISKVTYTYAWFDLLNCKTIRVSDSGFTKLDFTLRNTQIESLHINKLESSLNGELSVNGSDLIISEVYIYMTAKKMTLLLSDFNVKWINLLSLRNEGTLKLSNVNAIPNCDKTIFSIENSYLGKAEFYRIDFTKFNQIQISDSQLLDSSFMNVNWSSNIDKSFNVNEIKTKDYYAKQRETFRQLKFAFSKQGDIVNEQRFHGFEMTAFNKSLSNSRNNLGIKIILFLSRTTSSYGQSIFRPLVCLFIGHLLLFSVFMFTGFYAPLHFDLSNANLIDTWRGVSHYLETINPVRKYDTPIDYIFIDLLMRIWASYMIYNFIRASRRFIK